MLRLTAALCKSVPENKIVESSDNESETGGPINPTDTNETSESEPTMPKLTKEVVNTNIETPRKLRLRKTSKKNYKILNDGEESHSEDHCNKCGETGENRSTLIKCNNTECGKLWHENCLEGVECSENSEFYCPKCADNNLPNKFSCHLCDNKTYTVLQSLYRHYAEKHFRETLMKYVIDEITS